MKKKKKKKKRKKKRKFLFFKFYLNLSQNFKKLFIFLELLLY